MPETTNQPDTSQLPGAVIAPASQTTPVAATPIPEMAPQPIAEAQTPSLPQPVEPPITTTSSPLPQSVDQPDTAALPPRSDTGQASPSLSWTASEYIAHPKSVLWYGLFAIVAALIVAGVFLITKDITSAIALSLGAVVLAIYAGKTPREQQYQLDTEGFSIGQKRYAFAQFRMFTSVHEGNVGSVLFTPLKRFAPLTTIYYSPQEEDHILDIVEQVLPFEEFRNDPIDQLMRRIRF